MKLNTKATFFLNGNNFRYVSSSSEDSTNCSSDLKLPQWQSVTKYAYQNGMQIASHGYNHADCVLVGENKTYTEIASLDNLLYSIIKKKPAYFRPPYGSYNAGTIRAAQKAKHRYIVMWNADTLDWKTRSVSKTFAALKTIFDADWSEGLISLLHDPIPSSISYNLLSQVVSYGKSKGYKFVTMSECVGDPLGGYQ